MNATQLLSACTPEALCSQASTVAYGPAFAVLFAIVLMLIGTWYRHHHVQRTAYHRTVRSYIGRAE